MKKLLFFFLFAGSPIYGFCQELIPAEGAQLNFVQVLFQTPAVQHAHSYTFIVAPENGNLHSAPFVKKDPSHVTIIDGFEFGAAYKWLVLAKDKEGKEIFESEIHRFSIQRYLAADSTEYHYAIHAYDTTRVHDGVIFLDYSGVAIDRNGKAVWCLPNIAGNLRSERLRDLSMTEAGTLTFLSEKVGMEIDLQGNALWTTPGDGKISGDSVESYHHEFTRLNSGNYLIVCNGFENRTLDFAGRHFDRIPLSYIVEYDKSGDTVWTWHSGMYANYDDYLKAGPTLFNGISFGHLNSAYADEENGRIYASFRDLNAILVIDRKTREVLRSYGDKIPSDQGTDAIGFFKRQHAAMPFGENEVVVFNNNVTGATSSVVVFNEPTPENPECRLQWEFKCDFDSLLPGSSDRLGNVQPMPNDQFLVNMGIVARLFEVNREHEILWDCHPSRWNLDSSRWVPFENYRLHYRSSLYPCFFSMAIKQDLNQAPVLEITNEGSENDSYFIEIIVPGKKEKNTNRFQISVYAESAGQFEFASKVKKRILSKPFVIHVRSENNSELFREIAFPGYN